MDELKVALKSMSMACQEAMIKAETLKMTTNIPEICAFYRDIYESLNAFEELSGILSQIKEQYSKKVLPDLMQAQDVDNIRTAGKLFVLNPEFRVNMSQEKLEKGLAWLREKGYGMLIKEGVNSQTLTAAVKEYVKDKGELPPEDVMSIHMGHYISMRKAK